jgi:hypothetical protein
MMSREQSRKWRDYTRALLAVAGGVPALARRLQRSKQALYQWRRVPPALVAQLEDITGRRITRYHWRPDLYGMPEEARYEGRRVPRVPRALRRTLPAARARRPTD